MLQVQLHHGAPVATWLTLRELRGHDEAVLESGDPWAATALIGRLASLPAEDSQPRAFDAWAMSVSDRDRVAAALYRELYGSRIDTSIDCGKCKARMDIDFELSSVERTPDLGGVEVCKEQIDGVTYWLHEGLGRFRVPTVRDQVQLMRWPADARAEALTQRCLPDVANDVRTCGALEELLERVAPTHDVDLAATCPECETEQEVRFDLHAYLGASLLRESRYLTHEMHRIACAYGWGRAEILELRREERRHFVRLIEREGRAARR